VIGFVKSVALEVAEHGITANVVCPMAVDTPMVHDGGLYGLFAPDIPGASKDQIAERVSGQNPMKVPWLDVSDVVGAVLYLVSDAARYVSGETLEISGGSSASR
jgi:NAD(P)-dependent dehydrogenase (short-subunit alcohol dehydrogenase family)